MCSHFPHVLYRSLSGVHGLTRETLVALTTTIESREWMRRRRAESGLSPEHPRSSSTDDVECFFSILRNTIGTDFTSKKVMLEWRKVCQEFSKRINPELPFYYYTSTHDRFYKCNRDSFDVCASKLSKSNPRHQRVKRQEQPGRFTVGRATMIQPGPKSTIRRRSLPFEGNFICSPSKRPHLPVQVFKRCQNPVTPVIP